MNDEIEAFNAKQNSAEKEICDKLREILDGGLPEAESKIWHAHPVWFLNDNPTVGYSKLKDCIRLMFWSGADFGEPELSPGTGKFKDASIRYTDAGQINEQDVGRWIEKSKVVQWDYKNIRKRKGKLVRLL